jgi:hypothetical protein
MTMTLETANLIWNACYGDDLNSDGWTRYTSRQRAEAIKVRQDAAGGPLWEIWNISDRD